MPAVPVALIPVSAASPAAPVDPRLADPRLAGMDLDGWDVVAIDRGGAVMLSRPELGDQIPNYPQVWIRREQAGAAKPSVLDMIRFDCVAVKMRVLEAYSYAGRNLDGERRALQVKAGPWTPLQDGAQMRSVFKAACDQ